MHAQTLILHGQDDPSSCGGERHSYHEGCLPIPNTAVDGTVLTNDLIKELASVAEQGLPDSELTDEPSPWQQHEPMETHSLRIPSQLWELLEQQAQQHDMGVSEYTRQTITRGLLTQLKNQNKDAA